MKFDTQRVLSTYSIYTQAHTSMYTCTHARHETLYQLFSVALPITHLFGITLLS